MNKLILGDSTDYYGEYKEKLGIGDYKSFESFLRALEQNDATRNCGGMVKNCLVSEEKSHIEVLLWITKGMIEEIADKLDENIRYDGFVDNDFLCNTRDFLIHMYIKIKGYEITST